MPADIALWMTKRGSLTLAEDRSQSFGDDPSVRGWLRSLRLPRTQNIGKNTEQTGLSANQDSFMLFMCEWHGQSWQRKRMVGLGRLA